MPTNGKHCPFLNRADPRCSDAFSIEKLDHAFEHCFGRYTACDVYMELLIERRVRRSEAAATTTTAQHTDAGSEPLIQVTIRRGARAGAGAGATGNTAGGSSSADRNSKPSTGGAGVPALSGVGARAGEQFAARVST